MESRLTFARLTIAPDGGLAIMIAECCFSSLGLDAIGAGLSSSEDLSAEAVLLANRRRRIVVVSFDAFFF
jgi:hypothetical protein